MDFRYELRDAGVAGRFETVGDHGFWFRNAGHGVDQGGCFRFRADGDAKASRQSARLHAANNNAPGFQKGVGRRRVAAGGVRNATNTKLHTDGATESPNPSKAAVSLSRQSLVWSRTAIMNARSRIAASPAARRRRTR